MRIHFQFRSIVKPVMQSFIPRSWTYTLCFVLAAVAGSTSDCLADTIDKIVIRKEARALELLSGTRIIKSYKVALGRTPIGAKERQGDGKTPEGDYTISGRNPGSAFHRSLRVSYPNAADRKRAAKLGVPPGGDIMIHGLPPSYRGPQSLHTTYDWTEGCIAVTDAEIDEIWNLVKNGTRVTILP